MSVRRFPPFALTAVALLAAPPAAPAQPADQAAIDKALDAGVQYLRRSQKSDGNWGDGTGPGAGKGWGIGYTALAGVALIENGVPPSDPGLKKAAELVYVKRAELDDTYEAALAILFLDRMKDKSYKPAIQLLAARLIAAQGPTGGWGYKVKKLSAAEATQLLNALRRMSQPPPPAYPALRDRPGGLCIKAGDDVLLRPPPAFDPAKARAAALAGLPPAARNLPVFDDSAAPLPEDPKEALTDNSNTHFAMIGLWAARKHDVPADRTFALVNRRFRTTQGSNGTWAYEFARRGKDGSGPMSCVALLGVAIGYVVSPDPAVRPDRDPLLVKAFGALGGMIGDAAGTTANRPKVKDVGGLYFMWAMERIAVLYDLRKLNKKDWYLWGAEILIGSQEADGHWEEGGFHGQHPVLNTALAVLFLRRANLTPDLSRRLVVDTGVLMAKADSPVSPPPPPKADPPAPTPEPPKAVEPKKEAPAPTPPAPELPAPVAAPIEPPAKKTPWLFILLAMLLAGLLGGGAAYLAVKKMRKKPDGEEEEVAKEKPRDKSKKVKKKIRAEVDDE